MNAMIFLLLAGVLIVAGVLFFLMRHGPAQLDMEKYRKKWLEIERQLQKNDARSYQLCVIEADKLLDSALKESGVRGETMGERLKTNKSVWTNANAVWSSHKLRNQIVHETDLRLGYDDARRALAGFKRALKDMGAI